jgi:CheY-like chemotaxis protein
MVHFDHSKTSRGSAVTKHPERTDPLHILLAEDNAVNQVLVRALLQRHGHEVVLAKSGKEVLNALAKRAFDLVLMDVQMPELDGFETTAAIREEEANGGCYTRGGKARLPIVAMTGESMDGDRERCLQAGMDGYVSKPIHPPTLYGAIAIAIAGPTDPALAESDDSSVLSRAALKTAVGSKPERLRTLVDVFLLESVQLVADIRAAIAAQDAAKLRRAAHSLKGAVAIFGARSATTAARLLESLGESGELTDAPPALERLERQLERLKPALLEARSRSPIP